MQKINGAIGYVEYAYAKQNKMSYGAVKNKDGQFVLPDDETFKSAAAGADWAKTPGGKLPLIAEYTYTDLKLNVDLPDAAFSRSQLRSTGE